ncbi:hypothetical protein G210_0083 [Candida maltosa Xu316]|uniref:Uncharacterized protein n=1 Tax=Candida maltosa (strain Xu316) TaxID=1245528 RepID=M3K1R6_CANMX|nr:hypothetical protein G210_0083 [Candida maltosa Xu316]
MVLGIGAYNGKNTSTTIEQLEKEYDSAIVHKVVLFDTPEDKLSETNTPNAFFHNETKSSLTALETIFCDICGSFLEKLDGYVSVYANLSLRSPVSITDSQVLTKTINQAQKRLSSGSTSFKASFSTSSPPPESSASDKSRSHLKHLGRQRKLMGNFYLLAGKYSDAFQNFIECLTSLKKSDDYLWLASALEGLSVSIVLLQFINSPYQLPSQTMSSILQVPKSKLSTENATKRNSTSVESTVSTPRNSFTITNGFSLNALTSSHTDLNTLAVEELLRIILSRVMFFYNMSTNDFENMVPDIVYTESILRKIKLLISFHFAHSMDDIVRGVVKSNANKSFSKNDIIDEIDRIFQLQLVDMNILDQCRIYSALAAMYSDLGFTRKKAFILRILLVGLLPKLATATDLSPRSIKDILENLFVIYGISMEPEVSAKDASCRTQSTWTSLQIQVLRLALNLAESMKDQGFLLKLCTLLLTRYTHCLPADDQIKLKSMIDGILTSSRGLSVPYWDPFLVRKVKFIAAKSQGELVPFYDDYSNTDNSQEPFFDPYLKKKVDPPVKMPTLIMDDIYQLKITLQNPFSFEIEINDISIVSEGAELETIKSLAQLAEPSSANGNLLNSKIRQSSAGKKVSPPNSANQGLSQINSAHPINTLSIPAKSTEKFLISFKGLSAGESKITGFNILVGDCQPQFFQIVQSEQFNYTIKLKSDDNETQKTDRPRSTLDQVSHNLQSGDITGRATVSTLSLLIIPPQPSLTLSDISASNGCLMLLEGEKHEVSVTLTNHSSEVINYLSFSFWDSTVNFINKKLSNTSLSAAETHELEWHLLQFKPFRILNKDVIGETINPGQDVELKCELTSRKFMNESKIVLDYAHKVSTAKCFFKHLDIPLNVSVMPSIDVVGCDIFPVMTLSNNIPEGLQNVLSYVKNADDYCLLVLDLRNSWTEKLQCTLKYDSFEVTNSIQASKTQRFVLPLNRIDIDVTQVIPSLRKKQFVKNYNVTEEEEKQMKKLFWLRQSILEKLQGTWNLGKRHGIIDLRTIRLTGKMANILMYEKVQVSNVILTDDGEPVPHTGNSFNLSIDEFYVLKATISNHSDQPISGILRHLPYPLHANPATMNNIRSQVSIDRKMLINGTLQNKFPEVLPGEKLELEVSFVVIEKGEFEWGMVLDLLTEQIISREQIYITAH